MSLIFRGLSVGTGGGGGNGSANLTTLDVTPSINSQSILPNTGYDGFSLVNVSAVNSSIDMNISSENIRNGCEILGVTGTAPAPIYDFTNTKEGNGRYNVAFYNMALVNVSSEPPAKFGATIDTFLGDIVNGEYPVYNAVPADISLPFGITQIDDTYFPRRFYNSTTINSFESHVSTIFENSFNNAFSGSSLTSVKFPNLQEANIYSFYFAFANCKNIVDANFYWLRNARSNAFNQSFFDCMNLTTINFANLRIAEDNSFNYAFVGSNIQNVVFDSLTNAGRFSFANAFWLSNVISCDFPILQVLNLQSFEGAFQNCKNLMTANFTMLTSLTTQNYAFQNTFAYSGIQNVNMYKLQSAGYMSNSGSSVGIFENCFTGSNLASIFFANLINVSGNNTFQDAFANCNSLIYAHFPRLKNIYKSVAGAKNTPYNAFRNAFWGCSNLNSVKMPMLSDITGMVGAFENAFRKCPNLLYMEFPALQNIGASSFWRAFNDSGIKNIIFPQLSTASNNSLNALLGGTNDCVVHFPANMESTINTWASYAINFDGTNATILFDCYPVSSYYPITENGTIGSDTFAVNASIDSTNAYLAFDGDVNTGWQIASTDTPADYVIYTPKAVELTSINIQSIDNNAPQFINISGSNDGTNWSPMEIIVTTIGNASSRWANFTDPAYYKYYKVVCGAPTGGTMVTINSMDLVGHYIG